MNQFQLNRIYILLSLITTVNNSFAQTPVLFGLTREGGINNQGTLFKINGDGSGFSVVHYFDNPTGYHPVGSLLYYRGLIYGINAHGSATNFGNLYSFDPNTYQYTVLYDFDYMGGSFALNDNSPLLLARSDGKLYAAAPYGGLNDRGIIFSYEIATGIFTTLFSFNALNTGSPYGSVVDFAGDGKLYGLTYGMQKLYSFDLNNSVFAMEYNMSGFCDGGNGTMTILGNKLYGAAGNVCPFIFSYDIGINNYS